MPLCCVRKTCRRGRLHVRRTVDIGVAGWAGRVGRGCGCGVWRRAESGMGGTRQTRRPGILPQYLLVTCSNNDCTMNLGRDEDLDLHGHARRPTPPAHSFARIAIRSETAQRYATQHPTAAGRRRVSNTLEPAAPPPHSLGGVGVGVGRDLAGPARPPRPRPAVGARLGCTAAARHIFTPPSHACSLVRVRVHAACPSETSDGIWHYSRQAPRCLTPRRQQREG